MGVRAGDTVIPLQHSLWPTQYENKVMLLRVLWPDIYRFFFNNDCLTLHYHKMKLSFLKEFGGA